MTLHVHIKAFVQMLSAFDKLNDLKERNLIGCSCKLVAATRSRHSAYDSILP
jgi:uncharacterized membrane protein